MEHAAECVERYCTNRDPEAFAHLVEQYRPKVAAICRRYVIEPADVEDAVQETFVKAARRLEEVTGDVGAWLAAVAGTTALDYARRSLRERARRRHLVMNRGTHHGEPVRAPSWKAMEARLNEALAGLDPEMHSLVMSRFFTGEALKGLALRAGVNHSTMSRRVSKAVGKVRRALKAMGYESLEETLWDEDESGSGGRYDMGETAALTPAFEMEKIRVGVLISQDTTKVRLRGGFQMTVDAQLYQGPPYRGEGIQLILLAEPGTEEIGAIEQGSRERGITGGVIDVTDAEALKQLDVIVLGRNYGVTGRLLAAVTQAVESGVGLYNEGYVGSMFPGVGDPQVKRLFLAEKLAHHHTPGRCSLPRPATVIATHPILRGVAAGTAGMMDGCGPLLVLKPDAKVLVLKDEPVSPIAVNGGLAGVPGSPIPELERSRGPSVVVGQLGRGRVAMVACRPTTPLQELPGLRGQFVHNVLHWLAEERVAERRIWMGTGQWQTRGPEGRG